MITDYEIDALWEKYAHPDRHGYRDWMSSDGFENALHVALQGQHDVMEKDILALAGRLVFEDPDTMAPETREVVARWTERVLAQGSNDIQLASQQE